MKVVQKYHIIFYKIVLLYMQWFIVYNFTFLVYTIVFKNIKKFWYFSSAPDQKEIKTQVFQTVRVRLQRL